MVQYWNEKKVRRVHAPKLPAEYNFRCWRGARGWWTPSSNMEQWEKTRKGDANEFEVNLGVIWGANLSYQRPARLFFITSARPFHVGSSLKNPTPTRSGQIPGVFCSFSGILRRRKLQPQLLRPAPTRILALRGCAENISWSTSIGRKDSRILLEFDLRSSISCIAL